MCLLLVGAMKIVGEIIGMDENDNIWNEFNEVTKQIFKFVNGKKVILWGYGRSGWFIEHLFKKNHKQIEYIIDDGVLISPKLNIYRSFILNEMDIAAIAVLIAFPKKQEELEQLAHYGLKEYVNFIYLGDLFYGEEYKQFPKPLSYYDWLEYKYHMNILEIKDINHIDKANNDSLYYSCGVDYGLIDVLDNFCFDDKDAVFDFGCGKAGALLLFHKSGIHKIGGAEYDKDLYEIAVENLNRVGISASGLVNGDAALVNSELDEYNYFFMYNPFQGETFRQVIKNIESSYGRVHRRSTLIYSGTYCSDYITEDKMFKLSKSIYTDYSVRYVRIYTME